MIILTDVDECAANPCANGVCSESRQGLAVSDFCLTGPKKFRYQYNFVKILNNFLSLIGNDFIKSLILHLLTSNKDYKGISVINFIQISCANAIFTRFEVKFNSVKSSRHNQSIQFISFVCSWIHLLVHVTLVTKGQLATKVGINF